MFGGRWGWLGGNGGLGGDLRVVGGGALGSLEVTGRTVGVFGGGCWGLRVVGGAMGGLWGVFGGV